MPTGSFVSVPWSGTAGCQRRPSWLFAEDSAKRRQMRTPQIGDQQRQAGIGIWLAKDNRIGIVAIIAIASHLNRFIEFI
jgi:hypothetical protein